MELFRQEVALRQGINWGRVAFERSQARAQQPQQSPALQRLPPAVVDALAVTPVGAQAVDLSDALSQLSDDEAAVLFSQYKGCKSLSIRNWATPSAKALRALTLTIGSTLQFIDLSGSSVSDEHFDTLVACANRLRSIVADRCQHIGGLSLQRLPGTLRHTLTSLSISACPRINSESFLWLTGGQGHNTPTCAKLELLDISYCSGVNDVGITAVASRLKALRFLNLCKCTAVTDRGIVALGDGCPRLQVLSLAWLAQLTDNSIVHLAQKCTELVSLNLAQCSLLADRSVIAVAKNCPHLQAINVSGISAVTERAFGALARYCKGLLMLNATGCTELSASGLNAMVQGLRFVQHASSFYGFKPVEEATAKKLQAQLDLIHEKSASTIQRTVRNYYEDKQTKQRLRQERLNRAAVLITRNVVRYSEKCRAWKKLLAKLSGSSAVEVQRVWRGVLGRRKAARRRVELDEFRAKTLYATRIQGLYRSHLEQRRHREVSAAVEQLRVHRRQEAQAAVAVRLQAVARTYLARIRARIAGVYFAMLQADRKHAVITIQSVARMFICKLHMRQLQLEKQRVFELRSKAATRIQQFIRASYGRYSASLQAAELRLMKRARLRAVINIQRYYRGYVARRTLFKLQAHRRLEIRAAIVIQKTFRGSRVMRWQALRMNRAAAHILDRSVTEFVLRQRDCKLRELPVAGDSDSSDDEFAIYTNRKRILDGADPCQVWGGATNLVGKTVRVYWPVEKQWYDGLVGAWDPKRQKHKIQYSDEDREWISLVHNQHRVQIWSQLPGRTLDEGVWVLLNNYRPPESEEWIEHLKQQRLLEQQREAAWIAVNQWQPVDQAPQQTARYTRRTARRLRRKYLWFSQTTGEVRPGREDGHSWLVTPDENGWPVFVHSETGEVVVHDPRFEDDQAELKFEVLQGMRQTAYLCQDLLDKYRAAKPTGLRKALREISKSQHRKKLQSLAIQAKDLHEQKAIVNEPSPPEIMQEIERAIQLSTTLTELADFFAEEEEKSQKIKADLFVMHPDKLEEYLVCPHCQSETKREFYFCQTCGKQQSEFEIRSRPKTVVVA